MGQTGDNGVVIVGLMLAWNDNNKPVVNHMRHQRCNNCLHLTTYSVALDGFSVLFTYGKSRLTLFLIAFAIQHYKISVHYRRRFLVNDVVLVVFFEPVFRLHFFYRLRQSCRSGRQLMTTLVSSSSQNSSSAGCLHSCSEAMNLASLSFLGLVSSFHLSIPP